VSSTQRAVIVHGCCEEEEFFGDGPSCSNAHWLPWLQKQLVQRGIDAQTPEMPQPHQPEYAAWKRILERHSIDTGTVLVGHSCGAGFLLKWLYEGNATAQRLFLVAPWLDPFKVRAPFLDCAFNESDKPHLPVHILFSEDDEVSGVRESVDRLAAMFPQAKLHRFKDKGHFVDSDLGTQAFPELLDLIVERRA
jgi:predicted alpha/beta hydrolase family esterase